MGEELTEKLAETEQRARSNTRRIEGLERGQEALNRLATAVEVLAAKQESMGKNVESLSGKLDTLENRPARRGESLVDKLLLVVAGSLLVWLCSGAPGVGA